MKLFLHFKFNGNASFCETQAAPRVDTRSPCRFLTSEKIFSARNEHPPRGADEFLRPRFPALAH